MKRGGDNGDRSSPDGHFWLSCAAAALLTLVVVVALFGLHEWSSQRQQAAQSVSSLRTAVAVEQEEVLELRTRHIEPPGCGERGAVAR